MKCTEEKLEKVNTPVNDQLLMINERKKSPRKIRIT